MKRRYKVKHTEQGNVYLDIDVEAGEGDGTGLIAPHEAVSACLQGLQAGRRQDRAALFAQALPPEQAARVLGSNPRWDSATSLSVITPPKLGEVAVRYSARLQ
jgi:hypothetical protein